MFTSMGIKLLKQTWINSDPINPRINLLMINCQPLINIRQTEARKETNREIELNIKPTAIIRSITHATKTRHRPTLFVNKEQASESRLQGPFTTFTTSFYMLTNSKKLLQKNDR